MALAFYMDQHIPKSIALGLRLRGVDVSTAYGDGAVELTDSALLDRASDLTRVLFTHDDAGQGKAAARHPDDPSLSLV